MCRLCANTIGRSIGFGLQRVSWDDSNKQTWFAALGMFVILSCLNYIEKYAYTVLQNLYRIFFSSIVSMSGSA